MPAWRYTNPDAHQPQQSVTKGKQQKGYELNPSTYALQPQANLAVPMQANRASALKPIRNLALLSLQLAGAMGPSHGLQPRITRTARPGALRVSLFKQDSSGLIISGSQVQVLLGPPENKRLTTSSNNGKMALVNTGLTARAPQSSSFCLITPARASYHP